MCPPGELRRMAARIFGFIARAYLTLARSPPITGPLRIIWSSTAVTSMASDASAHAAAPKAETSPRIYLGNVTACRLPPRPDAAACCGRSLLLELRVGLLEGLAHRRPGLVGAASELQPGVARGRLHLAQLFPGLVLMLTDRGELLLVLRAHARLRLCGLAFPLRHLGVPLIELGLQLRDVFLTLGCHVALLDPRRKKVRSHITPLRSDRDARSELDHALRQQFEILRRRRAVALHPAKELAPPGQESRAGGARDGGPAEEERGLHGFQAQAMALEKPESARHVRLFHETVGEQRLIKAPALDHPQLGALAVGEPRHVRVDDREENDALVQDFVVLQV